MRENARTKSKRLLIEGRVLIRSAGPQGVSALVRGDSGCLRRVSYENARWFCDCPALGPCSHIMAVEAVVLVADEIGAGALVS